MLMDFTLCGGLRPAWPCKPKPSDSMAKDAVPSEAFGGFCTLMFRWLMWQLLSYTAELLGVGDTASLFPKQHLWAPHIRGAPVNSDRATSEAKHEHQHGLTPSWIIYFSVENQKMSKLCTYGTQNFSGSFKDKMAISSKNNWSSRKPFFPPGWVILFHYRYL